jgi:hypothetical protein
MFGKKVNRTRHRRAVGLFDRPRLAQCWPSSARLGSCALLRVGTIYRPKWAIRGNFEGRREGELSLRDFGRISRRFLLALGGISRGFAVVRWGGADAQPAKGSGRRRKPELFKLGAGDGTRTRDALLGRHASVSAAPNKTARSSSGRCSCGLVRIRDARLRQVHQARSSSSATSIPPNWFSPQAARARNDTNCPNRYLPSIFAGCLGRFV